MAADRALRSLVEQAKRVLGGSSFEIPAGHLQMTLKKGHSMAQFSFNNAGVAGYHAMRTWDDRRPSTKTADNPSEPDLLRRINSYLRSGYKPVSGPIWE